MLFYVVLVKLCHLVNIGYLLCWEEVKYNVEDVEGSPANEENQGDQEKKYVGSFPPSLLSSPSIQILQLVHVLQFTFYSFLY